MPRDQFSPPIEEEYGDDIDDPWQYATEYDYIHRHDEDIQPPPSHALAFHVHNVFDHLRDNFEEIMTTLGGRINISLLQLTNREIMEGLDHFFLLLLSKNQGGSREDRLDQLNAEGQESYNKLRQITEKLELAGNEHLTFETTNNIFTWIQFVLRQPESFQQHYLECFIRDTYYAYDGLDEMGNISCPKGIYERLLLAIGDACVLYCTQYKKKKKTKTKTNNTTRKTLIRGGKVKSTFSRCDHAVYRKLIRLFKKEVPDMNDLTKEWSSILEEDLGKALSPAQLKQHFIEFMDRKYTLYGLDYMNAINARADELDAADIFKNKTF